MTHDTRKCFELSLCLNLSRTYMLYVQGYEYVSPIREYLRGQWHCANCWIGWAMRSLSSSLGKMDPQRCWHQAPCSKGINTHVSCFYRCLQGGRPHEQHNCISSLSSYERKMMLTPSLHQLLGLISKSKVPLSTYSLWWHHHLISWLSLWLLLFSSSR